MTRVEVIAWGIFSIFARVSIVLFSILIGRFLADTFVLIPSWLIRLPNVTITLKDLSVVALHFGFVHVLLFAATRITLGGGVFIDQARTVREIYALILGFSVASLSLFFTTSINFSPELLLGSALSAFAIFVLSHISLAKWSSSDDSRKTLTLLGALLTELVLFPLRKPLSLIIIAFAMSPIIVAMQFVSNRDFANMVTNIRVALNTGSDFEWELVNAVPGVVFRQPMIIRSSPNDPNEAYVLERHGRIQRVMLNDPNTQKEMLLDFSDRVGYVEIELGALGLALHPNYGAEGKAERGYVFVYYTDYILGERQRNRLSRFDLSLPTLDARRQSETVLFDLARDDSGFHNGGSVEFGPDGYLYVALGEATDADGHQRIDKSLFGGIVRIDVDNRGGQISHPPLRQPSNGFSANYFIPNDNPFVGESDAMEEFFSIGLRNPFRISFDPETSGLWAGEVGSTKWEEVNLIVKGGNYQYPYIEGVEATNIAKPTNIIGTEVEPIYYYIHTAYERSVIGGSVYRGSQRPELYGQYIFADNYSGHIYSMPATGEEVEKPKIIAKANQIAQRGITSLVNSATGELFVTTLGASQTPTGKVLMLVKAEESSSYASADQKADFSEVAAEVSAQELYMTNCSRCHGLAGTGDGPDAPILLELDDVEVPDLTSRAVQIRRSNEEWAEIIAKGGEPFGLDYNMAPWEDILSKTEIDSLVQYLRELERRP